MKERSMKQTWVASQVALDLESSTTLFLFDQSNMSLDIINGLSQCKFALIPFLIGSIEFFFQHSTHISMVKLRWPWLKLIIS